MSNYYAARCGAPTNGRKCVCSYCQGYSDGLGAAAGQVGRLAQARALLRRACDVDPKHKGGQPFRSWYSEARRFLESEGGDND